MFAVGLVAPALVLSTAAQAQNADAAYNAFNSAFLVQSNGQIYYSQGLTTVNNKQDGEWTEALAITVAEDRYQYTHAQGDRDFVISLLNSLTYYNGPNSPNGNWQTDGWDDNLAWMVNPYLRGYQFTGISSYLTEAEAGWNNGYAHWDTTVAGGGIWENTYYQTKCALSNDPFVWEGVALYQATGNGSYLTKSEAIYNWVRSHLLVTTGSYAGQVHGCIDTNGAVDDPSTNDDNAFNDGSFLEAAVALYRVTGNQNYYNDARLVADHTVNKGSPLHDGGEDGSNQWAYWFTRGLSDFATENNLWSTYQSYLQSNANAAWNERSNLNITWNDWTLPTNNNLANPVSMSSAAAIWQQLLPPRVNLPGTYEIQNVASGMALNVQGASTTQGAPIIQWPFSSGETNALWKFVATSGGYYQIVNVNSNQVVNVTAASGLSGALIGQWPAASTPVQGNDQWLPVQNPDGTYSFYNLNSLQALDDNGGSTQQGKQFDQWFGNSTASQKFNLIPR